MPEGFDLEALIAAVDAAESVETLVDAVEALALTGAREALPTLLAALNFNNPGAAVAAVDGFIRIGSPAVGPLLDLLDNHNYGARAWALRALAGIGDPRALSLLLETAEHDYALSVRRAAARGLGAIRWQLLPREQVLQGQRDVLETLLRVMLDPEWVVRYAAISALQSLAIAIAATQPNLLPLIQQQLLIKAQNDPQISVMARATLANQNLISLNNSILADPSDGNGEGSTSTDWQRTLDQLYRRKSDERKPNVQEGDPRKFRAVVSQLQLGPKKKLQPHLNPKPMSKSRGLVST